MKTLFCVACLVLSIATLACRADEENLGIVTYVQLESDFLEDGALAVAKGDTSDIDRYVLRAGAYNRGGWGIPKEVIWRISDPTIAQAVSNLSEGYKVCTLIGLKDILDLGGPREPEVTITACVTNDCSGAAGCSPEVCSDPLVVRIVLNAEGSWRLEGAIFPSPPAPLTEVYIRQTGHNMEVVFSNLYAARVEDNGVTFSITSPSGAVWKCTGQFTDRERATGEVVQDPDTDHAINLGTWTATRTAMP